MWYVMVRVVWVFVFSINFIADDKFDPSSPHLSEKLLTQSHDLILRCECALRISSCDVYVP